MSTAFETIKTMLDTGVLPDPEDFMDQNVPTWPSENTKDTDWGVANIAKMTKFKNLGVTYEEVESHGGEDQGSDYYTIYAFIVNGKLCFIKFDGYYQSYNGSTFKEFYEVAPVEKVVTFYERVLENTCQ